MAKESEDIPELVVDLATERRFLAQAVFSFGDSEYEQKWRQKAEDAAKLVAPEKLAEDITQFIIDNARLLWFMESLIDEEQVQNHVAGELFCFYPEFTKNMLELHEMYSAEKPEFFGGFTMFITGKWNTAREPWYTAVRFQARYDKRVERIKGYVADGVRSKVKPFPLFSCWYQEALAHPRLNAGPSTLTKYYKKKYEEYTSRLKEELTENRLVENFSFRTNFKPQLSDHEQPRLRRKNVPIIRRLVLDVVLKAFQEGKGYKGVLKALDNVVDELTDDRLFQKWQRKYGLLCWTDIGKIPEVRALFQKWLSDQKKTFLS